MVALGVVTVSDTMSWPIQWMADFEIGIPVVDAQHRRLVEIANNLHALQTSPKRWLGALEDLMAYAQYHFSLEERLMSAVGFDGFEGHRLAHEALAERVAAMWHDRANIMPEQVLELLVTWVLNHILTCDQELRSIAHRVA